MKRFIRVPSRNIVALGAALVILLCGAWFWFRDSSLVAVKRVTVTGASGPDAEAIQSVLITAARNMTTLDVDTGQLRTAVSPYPVVKSLEVSTDFPHGMRIHVTEQLPVALIQLGGGRTSAVAADGTLLRSISSGQSLPTITLSVPPGGPRLTDPAALSEVAALAAAPYQLLPKISQIQSDSGHGLVAQLRSGPQLYLGDSGQLAQKWSAAVAVLADQGSTGAAYIDVSDPMRPAAGAGGGGATAAGAGSGSRSSSGGGATGPSASTDTGATGPSASTDTGASGASAGPSASTGSAAGG